MKIGKRNINMTFIFDYRHYLALLNIFRYCKKPLDFFLRYFLSKGSYPCLVDIKTPTGLVSPKIYYYDDSLTINEIFFRLDYKTNKDIKVFIDVGANIGISALYFLSRNNFSRGYLYEPVSTNLIKLNNNLLNFTDRIKIEPSAVYIENGIRKFGIEETGRLGGLNRTSNEYIEVNCVSINTILNNILQKESFIDVLKIDIEGDELDVVRSIDEKYLNKIGAIYFDIDYTLKLGKNIAIFPNFFKEYRYGNTYIMKNKTL